MLDQLPPELCAHIFDFACRDSGYTGRSLSLVSRYIHQTSEPARYTSIALINRAQILAKVVNFARRETRKAQLEERRLAALWPRTAKQEEELRNVRDVVRCESDKADLYLDTWGEEGACAVESILRGLAPTLEILDISLNEFVDNNMVHTTRLPRLTDLTTGCSFPLHPTDDVPVLEPTPSLRYFHFVDTFNVWRLGRLLQVGISPFAPLLTHWHLSEVGKSEQYYFDLKDVLAPSTPSTLELILIKPVIPGWDLDAWDDCELEYNDMLEHARRLRDKDHRVVLLQARTKGYFQEWVDKVDGVPCHWHWNTSDLDTKPAGL
ncbi:hypothetical protein K438DRAFT_1805721 [Mycena galopus ATCC 62051]|nr:hypothetical protein K438DRAFT_1805721 [Mycena galopus ATCC 62051]